MLNVGFDIYIILKCKWVVTRTKSQREKYTAGHLQM